MRRAPANWLRNMPLLGQQHAAAPRRAARRHALPPARAAIQELLPGILSQMGPESLQYLTKMAGLSAAPKAEGEEDLQVDFEAAGKGEGEATE